MRATRSSLRPNLTTHGAAPSSRDVRKSACARPTDVELPRAHHDVSVEQPVLGKIASFFREHRKSAAAVLAGASAVPAIGAPMVARAAPIASDELGPDVEMQQLAATMLFGEGAQPEIKATPMRASASLRHGVRNLPAKLDLEHLTIAGLNEAMLRTLAERMALQKKNTRVSPAVQQQEHKLIDQISGALDAVMVDGAKIPAELVRDLSEVTNAVADAKPGKLAAALDDALTKVSASMGSLTTDGVTGNLPAGDQLRALFDAPRPDVAARAANMIAAYTSVADPIASITPPPFTYTLPAPLQRQDGVGNSIRIPAGAQLSSNGGNLSINSPGLLMNLGGMTVVSGPSTLNLGDDVDQLSFANMNVAAGATSGTLQGVNATVDRASGTGVLTAQSAQVNLANGSVALTGGRLSLDPDGAARLQADTLFGASGASHGTLTGLTATQSADDTEWALSAFADHAHGAQGGTTIDADNFDISLVDAVDPSADDHAAIHGTNIVIGGDQITGKIDSASVEAIRKPDGSLHVDFSGDAIQLATGGRGISTDGLATAHLEYDAQGNLRKLIAESEHTTFTDPAGTLDVGGGKLDVVIDDDSPTLVVGQPKAGAPTLSLNPRAHRSRVHATAETVSWKGGDGAKLLVDGADLKLGFDAAGGLAEAKTTWGSLEGTLPGGGTFEVKNGGAVAEFEDGQLSKVTAATSGISYDGPGGKLDVTGRSWLDVSHGTDGAVNKIRLGGKGVSYATESKLGSQVQVGFEKIRAGVDIAPDGSQTITFDGRGGAVDIDGHHIALERVKSLEIQTDAAGAIEAMHADFPGAITLEDDGGDLKVEVTGASAEFDSKLGSRLSASFDEATVKLKSKKLDARINGAEIAVSERQLTLHVDEAKMTKWVGGFLRADVENVDLVIDKTEAGKLKAMDLKLEGLNGSVVGMTIKARTKDGHRVRLHAEMGEDGKLLRRAFLAIPDGGEIEIRGSDVHLIAGGGQTFELERDDSGAYHLGAKNLDLHAEFGKTKVRVDGGSADVSVDPSRGGLIIDRIAGTKVTIDHKKTHVDVDIKELDGFIFRMTGVKGAAKGASIHLVPTDADSNIRAEIRGNIGKVPFRLDLEDVHELQALAELKEDDVHLLIADPSGQGNIVAGVGPLELEGSAIELAARYHAYEPAKMLSLVGRIASKDGFELLKGVTIEPDGVVRVGTPNKKGPTAELTVVLPRAEGALPTYVFGRRAGAPGVLLSLGGRGVARGDTKVDAKVFAGALPGSYMDWNLEQGRAKLLGVPLPQKMKVPGTAVGGLSLDVSKKHTTVGATVGAFVNVGGVLPSAIPFRESVPYGGFAGLRVEHRGRVFGAADAVVDIDGAGQPTLSGARMFLGVRF